MLKSVWNGLVAIVKGVIATEPVRLMAVMEVIAVIAVTAFGLLTSEQAAGIIAAIAGTHELIRSIVYAPQTVANLAE